MRLIDADALLDFVDYYYDCTELGAIVSKWIDDAPTIDAVPREDYISMERTLARLQQGIADATDAPTIDAVEVVRCKDCKHKVLTEDGEYNTEDIVCDYWSSDGLNASDFCSYGERSEE